MVASLSDQEARFVIDDEGPGFAVDAVLDPTEEINMERMGGRGLLMIRIFMDEAQHNARGNSITMIKRVVPFDSSDDDSDEMPEDEDS